MYYKQIIAITLGTFCGTVVAFNLKYSSEIFLVSLFLFLINLFIHKSKYFKIIGYKNTFSFIASLFFIAVSFGILLGQIDLSNDIAHEKRFETFSQDKNYFFGKIISINQKQNTQTIIFETKDETENIFDIKITTENTSSYEIGETVNITGNISKQNIILPSINTTNKSLDIKNLDRLNNIDGEMAFPEIKIIDNNGQYNLSYKIQNYKKHITDILEKYSSTKGAALGSGTLIGDSSLFDKNQINDFRISGLSHIIVVSGFNITIIIFILIYIFSLLNLKLEIRLSLLILSILVFMFFVGFTPSIIRAGAMSITLLLSYIFGRPYAARQTLFIVSLFMIIMNPKISVYDISFHLSFLATFAILFIYPNLKQFLKLEIKNKNNFIKKILFSLFEIFLVTLSIEMITIPYTAFTFGYISIFGIFANILAVPVVPIIMLLGFLVFAVSLIPPFAFIFGIFLSLFSNYIFYIANIFANISFAKIQINFSFFSLIVYYILIILFLMFEEKRKEIKKYLEKIN